MNPNKNLNGSKDYFFLSFCGILLFLWFLLGLIDIELLFALLIIVCLELVLTYKTKKFGTKFLNITVSISAFLITVIFCELVLRYNYVSDFKLYPNPKLPVVSRHIPNRVLEDPACYGDLTPLIGDKSLGEKNYYKVKTDNLGFTNGRNISKKDTFDLIILGDSYSVTDYFRLDESLGSWPAIFQKQNDYGIMNLAMIGTGPWEQYINLLQELPHLNLRDNCTLLWCFFSGNDLDDHYGNTTILDEVPKSDAYQELRIRLENFREQSALKIMLLKIYTNELDNIKPDAVKVINALDLNNVMYYKPHIKNSKRSLNEIISHPNFDMLVQTIDAVNKIASGHSLNLKLLVFPSKAEVYSWMIEEKEPWTFKNDSLSFSTAIKQICYEYSIDFYDLTPYFKNISQEVYLKTGNLLYDRDGSHWNFLGHIATQNYIQAKILSNSSSYNDPYFLFSEKLDSLGEVILGEFE